ncbi:T4SS effector phosphatidylinositol 3-Kinase RisK1 [Rickettsia endosymbiont of Halotydeus destructor]|uniref:T4SS effector phosphatidylinositol 3-Kinase RisK1 n=1 Tax=Rickettsia endosymbiont of Halotydeus destructor TaxID=2996754 RepID=UPI003BB0B854
MSKERIEQESLKSKLFEVLKTKDEALNAKIFRACEGIAEAAIDLSNDQSPTTTSLYISQVDLANLNSQDLAKVTKIIKDSFPGEKNKELREIIDTPLLQEIVRENATELQVEVDDMRHKADYKELKGIINAPTPAVNDMLRDKRVAQQSEFTEKGAKTAGVSTGYVATDKEGNTFILKHFYKTHDACLEIQDKNARKQAIADRRDGVQELIGSTMYQFLLHDRAPKEGLVKADEHSSNSLYVRSKFFDNAVTLTEFSGLLNQTKVRANDKNLKNLEGFEKAIAACHMLGEGDYHAGNLMVQDGKTVTKIDHGRSFLVFHDNFSSMIQSTAAMFAHSGVGYGAAIKAGNLSFSIDKYSESLNQMISQFDEKQMEAIVDQKIDELKKAGFDPKNIALSADIKNFDDLRKHYKDNIKENLVNMKEVAKSAEIVTKFSNVSPEFKNGGWLEAFANSAVRDPVLYAAKNKIQIDGKDALEWAYENDYQIKTPIGLKKETIQEKLWKKDSEGKWKQREGIIEKDKVDMQLSDPVESMRVQDKAVGEKLESLVVDFTKQTVGKKITDKEIEKFYANIMNELKKENYLTDQNINNIKNDPDYKRNIKETTKLINLATPNLTGKDKIYYKVANFCRKIGLPNISNYFVEKISPANLSKLYETENIIHASIKIGSKLKSQVGEFQTKRLEEVKKITQSKLNDKMKGKKLQTRL